MGSPQLLDVKSIRPRNSEGGLGKAFVKEPDDRHGKTIKRHNDYRSHAERVATARSRNLRRKVQERLNFASDE